MYTIHEIKSKSNNRIQIKTILNFEKIILYPKQILKFHDLY